MDHDCEDCIGDNPGKLLRKISEFIDHIEIVGREKNELLDDLVFKEHKGPLRLVIRTKLPNVTWRKA